jgi:DNA mismatch repair protein MutS2
VNEEWERLRASEKTRADLTLGRKRLSEVARSAEAIPGEPPGAPGAASRPAAPGDQVEVAHLGLKGEILAVDGGTATVRAGTLTVKVPFQALRVIRPGGTTTSLAPARSLRIQMPERSAVAVELHLIGRTSEEARDLLEKYLDDAFLAGLPLVRIIHGKGTGALRRAVEEVLSAHPLVAEHRPGALHEGGAGATIAVLGQT